MALRQKEYVVQWLLALGSQLQLFPNPEGAAAAWAAAAAISRPRSKSLRNWSRRLDPKISTPLAAEASAFVLMRLAFSSSTIPLCAAARALCSAASATNEEVLWLYAHSVDVQST